MYTKFKVCDLCLDKQIRIKFLHFMKLKDKKLTLLQKVTSKRLLLLIAFVVVGIITVLATQAAINFVSLEPENGTKFGNVSTESDSSASNGSFIKFGQQPYTNLFVSTSGNDSKNGSSQTEAVKTISRAVNLATGRTRIRILAGTYTESVRIQKNDLIIEPFGNGDVSIVGAIPEFIQSVNWTYVQPGIYKYNILRNEFRSDGNPIFDSSGKQQWSYPDIFSFQSRATINNLPGVFLFNNFFSQSEVYVATSSGQPPTAPLYIGALIPSLDIQDSNNISINSAGSSKLKIAYGSTNIMVRNSNDIKIDNVEILGGAPGIAALNSSNVSIINNKVSGTFDRNWYYSDVKERLGTHSMEHEGILVRADNRDISNVVVDNNEISGYFDGIQFPSFPNLDFKNTNSVISNNIIHDFSADGIEAEAPLVNLVIKGNIIYDTYVPFAAAGQRVGPVYVYENLFIANRIVPRIPPGSNVNEPIGPAFAIKMNQVETTSENIHFYHNSLYFAGNPGNVGLYTVHSTPSLIAKNISFINNIFYSYGGGILRGTGRAADNVQWDGNVFYSQEPNVPDESPNYHKWNVFYDDNPNYDSYQSLSDIINAGKIPIEWQGNVEVNPNFNCIVPTNFSCFRPSASIAKPSTLQPIPSGFAESSRLNSRTKIGAFE